MTYCTPPPGPAAHSAPGSGPASPACASGPVPGGDPVAGPEPSGGVQGAGGEEERREDEPPTFLSTPYDLPWPAAGIVRAVRRRADASQRELARWAGVHHGTVGRIEAGALTPSIALLRRIIAAAGFRLAVVDEFGRVLTPMRDRDDIRDGADRRYPSHLDTILDPEPGEWWADVYGLARPPETFYRNRAFRDAMRRRSQWEVRVAKYRNVPPPPRAVRR
ncbi:helix-turn-helix transcriptional regulator [Micromonospora sp. HUAS LYJ1]|uniref:helix-turn-helix transcriptional regulator n=1 Tax=Micromonospora sp. HUAS LYJ1 TaxID=3061626 RepID=UPI0026719B1A|nr:helix-turn-helix transcriptional regulator [Micromonospora sp. HUAS LYJ1]WKU02599.1 helix-turn-helix transcriptional regulator [Micromonospora sp. HUAS LYJ1]